MSRYLSGIILMFMSIVFAAVSSAAPPKTISYQGYLKDGAGKPVTAATNLTFRLYSSTRAESGALWSEAKSVTPANGVYSVELGTGRGSEFALPFDRQYFIGVTVEGGPELVPRQPLTSVPYTFKAMLSDRLNTATQIVSTVPTGTAPLQISSSTLVPNLNADMVDGKHADDFVQKSGDTMTGSLSTSGQLVTTVPTGTPPLQVSSTTLVPNLNADMVDGKHAGDFVLKAGDTRPGTSLSPR